MKYRPRLIENKIKRILKSSGALLLEGPKFVGKTTTCKLFAKSDISLVVDNVIQVVKSDPSYALSGEKPHLIDEWQTVPEIWDLVREKVDDDGEFGEYILTGSATPASRDKIHHSGAGRIAPLKMRTMSLFESNDSLGLISLKELFENGNLNFFHENKDFSLERMAFLICRGGWPLSINDGESASLGVTKNYYQGLFNFKNSDNVQYKNKNPEFLRMVLRSYARNISSEAGYQTILEGVQKNENRNMTSKTFDAYLKIAKELFIIEDMEAWRPSLRSNTVIRTTSTRHFYDPSIAARALGISPSDLLLDGHTFGLFFEDLAIRDLRVYVDSLDGTIRHYRDKNGLECDAVVHLEDGRWAPIEIKLGSKEAVDEGARKLNLFVNKLDGNYSKPAFKAIITAVGMAYKRPDGIYVIPLNLLKN